MVFFIGLLFGFLFGIIATKKVTFTIVKNGEENDKN